MPPIRKRKPSEIGNADAAACAAANEWYENSPVKQYVSRKEWYSKSCEDRTEFSFAPEYYLNVLGVRAAGDVLGIKGVNAASAEASAKDAADSLVSFVHF